MIYCPKCGTANRDMSRFCNECGHELGRAMDTTCPQCGHRNPVQSIFCQQCGERLEGAMPLPEPQPDVPPIKGLSLPVKGQEGDDEPPPEGDGPSPTSEVPGWLQGLSAAFPDGIAGSQAGEDEIPVWLAELGAGLPGSPDPDGPSEPQPSSTEGAGEPLDAPSAPGDRRSPRADVGAEEPALAAVPEEDDRGVPAWLLQLLAEDSAPEVGDGAAPDAEAEEGAGPDWLGVQLPKEAKPSESFFPPDSPEADLQPAAAAQPAWLAELQGDPATGSELAGGQGEPDEVVPSIWLEGLEPEEEMTPHSAGLLADAEVEPGPAGDEAAPVWPEEVGPQDLHAPPPAIPPAAPGDEPTPAERAWSEHEGEPEREPEPVPPVARPAPKAILGAEAELAEAEWLGWMEDLEPEEVAHLPPVAPEGEPELAEDEVLDWVRDLRRGEMAPVPSAALPVAEAEPESRRREEPVAGRSAVPLPGVGPENLSEEPEGVPELPEEGLPPARALERGADLSGDRPSWLDDVEDDLDLEDHWLMHTVPEPLDEIPDWMAALRPGGEAAGEPEEPAAEGMPDWLLTWTEDLLAGGEEELALADIPEWLWALRPQTPLEVQRMPGADRVVETRGVLAGRKGVLPVEPIMALPPSGVGRPASLPPEDKSRADLFRQVATQPPMLRPLVPGRPGPEAVPPVARWLVSVLLLAAVIVPLVYETNLFARPAAAPAPVQALYDVVAALERDAPVLVVFDYTPTHAGEMDLIAETVTGHLVDRGARIVALSLAPTGPQLAQEVLDRVTSGRADYAYCHDYVNLGYVPGQVAALRSLVQSLWEGIPYDHLRACTGARGELLAATELPVTAGVDDIGDFALVVDLASQQAGVRWWIEQVGSQVEGLRLVAGVGAAAEPFVRPYADATPPQVVGYVAGWPQVGDYLALQGRRQWTLEGRLDAQIVGHGAMILILLAGNVAHVIQWASRRGR